MKAKWLLPMIVSVLLLALMGGVSLTLGQEPVTREQASTAAPLGANFTYQGRLEKGERTFTQNCDMAFRLYDQESAGSLVGSAISDTVPITNSLFTVQLDFGTAAFDGDGRWLEIAVHCPGDLGYTTLPRQGLTAAPYALYSLNAGQLEGKPESAFFDLGEDETVTGRPAFNGGESGVSAPFTVDSTTRVINLNADQVDGLHGSNLARITRYSIPGGGGTVTMTIPHYNTFQISIGEAYGSPGKVAWLTLTENDYDIAWTGIDHLGNVTTGTAGLDSTTTIISLGGNITLRCPGNNQYELVLTSTLEDVRAFLLW